MAQSRTSSDSSPARATTTINFEPHILTRAFPASTTLTSVTQTANLTPTILTTLTTATTATSTSVSTTTALPTSSSATSATTKTEIYYPPASSTFALSVPTIIGVVVAGVGFLVLLAIIAAFTVCFLDRKKESKAEKEERKRVEKKAWKGKGKAKEVDVEAGERESSEASTKEPISGQEATTTEGDDNNAGESVIGPRYAAMIGVNPNISNPPAPTQTENATKAKPKPKERERTIVHLPVHVADLGAPRESQVQYEREDPGDEERDERGFRRGASWWHPEL
jgi:hypothetical protein